MKRALTIAVVCAAGLGLTATRAEAIALTIGDAQYVGNVIDGIPSSEVLEAGYINWLITLAPGVGPVQLPGTDPANDEIYDRTNSPASLTGTFPQAILDGALKVESRAHADIDVTGFTYILAKYDASKPGAGAHVWLVSSLTVVNLPANSGQHTLGHYTLFNANGAFQPVPDGGTTLILLGGALIGLGALRRRFNA
jgi:hypothetical protein